MLDLLEQLARSVPPGQWAIGVSGGADSVALLHLVQKIPSVTLHVVHLNHETRGEASDGDADFVGGLAANLGIPATIARRCEIENDVEVLPANRSARFRKLRQSLFASVVKRHALHGILLAHHAGDQAETVLQRLLRGSGWQGLCGMPVECKIGGILYFRPLLTTHPQLLRTFLSRRGETWREDASNQSTAYQRNRARRLLRDRPALAAALVDVAASVRSLRRWVDDVTPPLQQSFDVRLLNELPSIQARRAASGWLRARGVPPDALTPSIIDRLLHLASDAATAARSTLPGNVRVDRKRQLISASPALSPKPATRIVPPSE